MAGNNIVINSRFNPFTYQEMLAPVQIADTEHKQLESAMGELSAKASIWDGIADEQSDPLAYKMYKDYSEAMERQVAELAEQGLTRSSRRSFNNLRNMYSTNIVPIEQAYMRRAQLVDTQAKQRASDSSMIFDRDAADLTLTDLIRNPTLTPTGYSGNMLMQQTAQQAQNLARDFRSDPSKWRSILGGQAYETIRRRGYRPEEILSAINNTEGASQELLRIKESVLEGSGIRGWNNQQALEKAQEHINRGLWSAVGDAQPQVVDNKSWMYQNNPYYNRGSGSTSAGTRPPDTYQWLAPEVRLGMRNNNEPVPDDLIKDLNGLEVHEDGSMSTLKIRELRNKEERLLSMANQYSREHHTSYLDSEERRWGWQPNQVSPVSGNRANPYTKELQSVRKELDQENKKIISIRDKYSHLDQFTGNPQVSIARGLALEKQQSMETNVAHPVLLRSDGLNKVTDGIVGSYLVGGNEDTLITELDDQGNPSGEIKVRKFRKLIEDARSDEKPIGIHVDQTKGLVLDIGDGKSAEHYIISGIRDIDSYNKLLGNVDRFSKDYSREGLQNIVDMRSIPEDINERIRFLMNKGEDLGGGFIGINLIGDRGTIIKEYYKDGIPVAWTSMDDEITGASRRGAFQRNLANLAVPYLVEMFSGNKLTGNTLPEKTDQITFPSY